MKQNQVKWGVILSYLLIILNTLYGLVITPFMIGCLGDAEYGVYKTVASLSASLAVMDLGLGATMTRYMARFHAHNDKEGACNFAGMIFAQYGILAVLLVAVGVAAYSSLDTVYAKTFSDKELILAKRLLAVLILNMSLRLLENLLSGIANGYERFGFSNGMKLAGVILKFSCLIALLPVFSSALLIVFLETMIVCVSIAAMAVYVICRIGIVPRIKKWDTAIFKESMGYTLLMFVQTITIQFNGNVDNILIGAQIGATSVAVYSVALTMFAMYETLSGSIANIMLPNMTKRVVAGQSARQLQNSVEQAGRFQFLLLAAALGGFAVLGKDFYRLWLGDGFEDCYLLTLILIVPVTFPMIQNVALSILRAQNKMRYRTVTLMISCGINIVVSFVGIKIAGYWGAAIGTACATMSNLVFMNAYYKRHLNFRIIRLFANITKRTWLCAVVSSVAAACTRLWLHGTWVTFVLNVAVFMLVYGALLFAWGLTGDEKRLLIGRFGRKNG